MRYLFLCLFLVGCSTTPEVQYVKERIVIPEYLKQYPDCPEIPAHPRTNYQMYLYRKGLELCHDELVINFEELIDFVEKGTE